MFCYPALRETTERKPQAQKKKMIFFFIIIEKKRKLVDFLSLKSLKEKYFEKKMTWFGMQNNSQGIY